MATQAQYDAAAAAALKVLQTEIAKEVPAMFQSEIPQQLLQSFATEVSKASVDAAEGAAS